MSTGFADERLSAYVDGELDAAERRRLELELERDPELRAEVEALQATQSLLQRHGPAVAPTDFRVRVLEAGADEPVSAPWWAWLRRPFGLPSEGLLVAAVIGVSIIPGLILRTCTPNGSIRPRRPSVKAESPALAAP